MKTTNRQAGKQATAKHPLVNRIKGVQPSKNGTAQHPHPPAPGPAAPTAPAPRPGAPQYHYPPVAPKPELAGVVAELRERQRLRVWFLKSRIMVANRLRATVANALGYTQFGTLEERGMAEAQQIIDRFALTIRVTAKDAAGTPVHPATRRALAKLEAAGDVPLNDHLYQLVKLTTTTVVGFDDAVRLHEKAMETLAKTLPVYAWVKDPARRGFAALGLAAVIGECGDLGSYANPGKLWRRLGCAPVEATDAAAQGTGPTKMASTWRRGKEGHLAKEQWEAVGYNPRRRSLSYLIGDCLVKQNHGEYRQRYDAAKAAFFERHPDYLAKDGKSPSGRVHLHATNMAAKLLLKNLWLVWNGRE